LNARQRDSKLLCNGPPGLPRFDRGNDLFFECEGIFQESNPVSGAIYDSLIFDPTNPLKRTVQYSDLRTIAYEFTGVDDPTIVSRTDSLGRKTSYQYDSNGILLGKTDGGGHTFSYTYDNGGNLTSIMRDSAPEGIFQWDSAHRLISSTDRFGNTNSVVRDANGRVVSRTHPDNGVESFSYDALGRVTAYVTPRGAKSTYTWDSTERLASFVSSDGNNVNLVYDTFDRVASMSDSLGRQLQITRNPVGRVTKRTHGDGHSRTFTYDVNGRCDSAVDEHGATLNYAYDDLGRVASTTDQFGGTKSYDYAELPGSCSCSTISAHPTKIVKPDGSLQLNLFDTEGRLLSMTLGAETATSATTTYTYDADNNLISGTDPAGAVRRYKYDNYGRRVSEQLPDGSVTTGIYDQHGNLSLVTQPDGTKLVRLFDAGSHLVQQQDELGRKTTYEYTAGQVSQVTDASGKTFGITYDPHGRLVRLSQPDGSTESWSYDVAGRPVSHKARDGSTRTSSYDISDHPITETSSSVASTTTTRRTYDSSGRVASVDNGVAVLSYTYTSGGLVASETSQLSGLPSSPKTVSYVYDSSHRKTSVSYPDGTVVSYGYDSQGRISTIGSGSIVVATYKYDPAGQILSVDVANNVHTSYIYDAMERVSSSSSKNASGVILGFQLGRDSLGRIISISQINGSQRAFTYDAAGQLLTDQDIADTTRSTVFAYDTSGNWTTVKDSKTGAHSYSANTLNQYTNILQNSGAEELRYDSNGNQISANAVKAPLSISYDLLNRVSAISNESVRCIRTSDPKGRCILELYYSSDSTGNWTLDPVKSRQWVYSGWQTISEYGLDDKEVASYVNGARPDEVLLYQHGSTTLYPLMDYLGSTVALTDATGAVTERYKYDAFGTPTILNAQSDPAQDANGYSFLFAGRRWIGLGHLYDSRFRMYSSDLGRFLQPDPMRLRAGYNLYSYAYNNPVSNKDPMGLSSCTDCRSAPPLTTDNGNCSQYGSDMYLGISLQCFCNCAGDSDWSQQVRGCLSCYYGQGTNEGYAHASCYEAAGITTAPTVILSVCYIACLIENSLQPPPQIFD
jgi:RHS repeat-associated protein